MKKLILIAALVLCLPLAGWGSDFCINSYSSFGDGAPGGSCPCVACTDGDTDGDVVDVQYCEPWDNVSTVSTWSVYSGSVYSATFTSSNDILSLMLDSTVGLRDATSCPSGLDADGEWCWVSNVMYLHSDDGGPSDPDTRYAAVNVLESNLSTASWTIYDGVSYAFDSPASGYPCDNDYVLIDRSVGAADYGLIGIPTDARDDIWIEFWFYLDANTTGDAWVFFHDDMALQIKTSNILRLTWQDNTPASQSDDVTLSIDTWYKIKIRREKNIASGSRGITWSTKIAGSSEVDRGPDLADSNTKDSDLTNLRWLYKDTHADYEVGAFKITDNDVDGEPGNSCED